MARSLRSNLYRAARTLGTAQAAAKGPAALGKRMVRKQVYRRSNTGLAGILRAIGLQGKRR